MTSSVALWGQETKLTSDQAFAEVEFLARPINPRPVPAGGTKSRAEFVEDQQRQSAGFLYASEKAREFHTKNPTHEKAAEAKHIEAVSLLRAVQTGSVTQEPKALRLGHEFRADSTNASAARFQVASTMTQIKVSKKQIRDRDALMAEYEQSAFDLYGEFPNEPQVFEMMLGVARNSKPEKARALVERIHRMPAPAEVKAQAADIVARLDMPGKSLPLEWQDENGDSRTLAEYKGRPVVFYVWGTGATGSESALAEFAKSGRSDVEIVSVNIDRNVEQAKTAKRDGLQGKSSYFDERGLDGPLAKQLKVARVPAVHVVDASGVYIGVGAPSELESLLAQAKR